MFGPGVFRQKTGFVNNSRHLSHVCSWDWNSNQNSSHFALSWDCEWWNESFSLKFKSMWACFRSPRLAWVTPNLLSIGLQPSQRGKASNCKRTFLKLVFAVIDVITSRTSLISKPICNLNTRWRPNKVCVPCMNIMWLLISVFLFSSERQFTQYILRSKKLKFLHFLRRSWKLFKQ